MNIVLMTSDEPNADFIASYSVLATVVNVLSTRLLPQVKTNDTAHHFGGNDFKSTFFMFL